MRALCLLVLTAMAAYSDAPAEPPTLIRLIRTPTGGDPTYPYRSQNAPVNVFGMSAVTGLSEYWLMECHDSFAGLEAVEGLLWRPEAREGGSDDVLGASRTVIALFRPNWSFRPDEAIRQLPKSRYMFVSIYRVRPGAEVDFGKLAALRKLEFDLVNSNRPEMAYQVISGSSSGTFLFFAPLTTLRTLDESMMRQPAWDRGGQSFKGVASTMEVERQHLLLRLSPKLSWVSSDVVAEDEPFWTGKSR